jgi:signal transduction histidine kinase
VYRLAIAFGGGVIVVGLLGVYLTRRLTRPLATLAVAADEIAGGDYAVELPPRRGGDEIAALSRSFGEMAEKLAESEQLSRNFLMSVSHELRTPLTAIRGHVSALREGVIDDPSLREASLAVIEQEAMRLERLVGDVLDLAKLDAHRFTVLQEEVDMEQLTEQAFSVFGEEARRRAIDFRADIRAHPVIVTDGDRVLQIISNLLSNAFRWTPEGGRIELELGAENGSVSVAVSDTGPGITQEERDRIFRPFWSRDGGGTGLGLAIARELAFALGGRIELRSQPGLGSRFELVLPSS